VTQFLNWIILPNLSRCFLRRVADNAAVNKATVKVLKSKGWRIEYVRCLPHCLNLVIVAFLDVFNETYCITSFLAMLRGFMNAGGSSNRRAKAVEACLSVSQADYSDTRWSSLIEATTYMTSKISNYSIKMARSTLKRKADAGDEEALASLSALPELNAGDSVWSAFLDLLT
jgi:hypothetical protein